MKRKPTLLGVYRLTQVLLLVAFVAALALLHFRGREAAEQRLKENEADRLLAESIEQQNEARALVVRAQEGLAKAEAWKPSWAEEVPEKPKQSAAEPKAPAAKQAEAAPRP